MSDGAIAMCSHKDHLVVPCVGVERPAMAEDDGLASTPVFEEDLCALNALARRHRDIPSWWFFRRHASHARHPVSIDFHAKLSDGRRRRPCSGVVFWRKDSWRERVVASVKCLAPHAGRQMGWMPMAAAR